MRVLVTGARALTDPTPVYKALNGLRDELFKQRGSTLIVVHGDCPQGADRHARNWCEDTETFWVHEERHPADWDTHGKSAGFRRNQKMVDLGADLVLAFLRGEANGTYHTVAAAKKAGLKVIFG